MKKLILAAMLAVFSTTQMAAMVETKIKEFDVKPRNAGVNVYQNLMYVKTDLTNCAYDGRLAFKFTAAGEKAFDIARDLSKEGKLIGQLVYDVSKVVQTDEGPKDVCWGTNVREP